MASAQQLQPSALHRQAAVSHFSDVDDEKGLLGRLRQWRRLTGLRLRTIWARAQGKVREDHTTGATVGSSAADWAGAAAAAAAAPVSTTRDEAPPRPPRPLRLETTARRAIRAAAAAVRAAAARAAAAASLIDEDEDEEGDGVLLLGSFTAARLSLLGEEELAQLQGEVEE